MQCLRLMGSFVALAAVSMVAAKSPYLEEKPDFITTCSLADSNFESCFADNFVAFFREWKNGVPGRKSFGTFDPLLVKRIKSPPIGNNDLVELDIDLMNVKMFGLSAFKVEDLKFDIKSGLISVKLLLPKLSLSSDYTVKGRLLNLPLDSSGDADANIADVHVIVDLKLKLRDEFGYTFTDIEKLALKFKDIGGFHIELRNLFKGNKELEDSTNQLINQSWRDFYAVLQPAITEAIQIILFDRMGKLFKYVPANYLIGDIPTAAEFYG